MGPQRLRPSFGFVSSCVAVYFLWGFSGILLFVSVGGFSLLELGIFKNQIKKKKKRSSFLIASFCMILQV